MLSRFVIVTTHGEDATVWTVWDTEAEFDGVPDSVCVESFNSARGQTFGDAYQHCAALNRANEGGYDAAH